jgi:CheY-like chemotaxis protein
MAEVVDEAARAVAARLAGLGLTLTIDVPTDLPHALVDRVRIRQILINLLNNAAKFTDAGGIKVCGQRIENEIVVQVVDTGIGIPAEELPRVFDEFHQTDGAVERRVGGSGLGLTISRRLIEMHGGAMWVASTVGVGSTFSFSLPLASTIVSAGADGATELWDRRRQARRPETPALAVVAPDPNVARMLQRYVDDYRLLPVASVAGVAELIDEPALAGVVVATGSADESWSSLHALGGIADSADLPIAFCTVPAWASRAAELGVAEYLGKPIRTEQLAAALTRLEPVARTVLVVDDSADMVRLLARTVRGLDRRRQVLQATGGAEALAIMRQHRPDVVLLDLLMPGIDGYDVIARMRADSRLRDVPVIVVSARGASADQPATGLVGLTRQGGLSIGEMTACLKACFDQLRATPEADGARRSVPVPAGDRRAIPASAIARPRRGTAPAPLHEAPSR